MRGGVRGSCSYGVATYRSGSPDSQLTEIENPNKKRGKTQVESLRLSSFVVDSGPQIGNKYDVRHAIWIYKCATYSIRISFLSVFN